MSYAKEGEYFKKHKSIPSKSGGIVYGKYQKGGKYNANTYATKWFKPYEKSFNLIDWNGLREKMLYHRVEEVGFELQSNVGEQGVGEVTLMDLDRLKYIMKQDNLTIGVTAATPTTGDTAKFMNRMWFKKSLCATTISNTCNVPVRVRVTVYDYVDNSNNAPTWYQDLDRAWFGYANVTGGSNVNGLGSVNDSTYDITNVTGLYPYTTGTMKNITRIRYQKDLLLNTGNSADIVIPTQWHRKIINPMDIATNLAANLATSTYVRGASSVILFTVWSKTVGSTSAATVGTNTENYGQAQIAVKMAITHQWYVADTISTKHNYFRSINTVSGAAANSTLKVIADTNDNSNVFKGT